MAALGLDPRGDGRHVMLITYVEINIQIYSPMDIYFDGYHGAPRLLGCMRRAPSHPFRYAREIPADGSMRLDARALPTGTNGQTNEQKAARRVARRQGLRSLPAGAAAREEEVAASLSLSSLSLYPSPIT